MPAQAADRPNRAADPQPSRRASYRGPAPAAEQIQLEIAGALFPVLDIGSQGIGIRLPAADPRLKIGSAHALFLHLGGDSLELRGEIKHISPDEEGFHCGIALTALDRHAEQQLQTFLLRQCHQMIIPEE